MRILHLNEHLDWKGGVEVYLLHLVPELEARGHDVVVGYAHGTSQLVERSVSLSEISSSGRKDESRGYRAAMEVLGRYEPDLVHLHQAHNKGVISACLENVPTIVHGHDYRYLCPASTFYFRRSESICNRTAGAGCFAMTLVRHCLTPRPRYAVPYYRRVSWVHRHRDEFAHVIAPSESCRERFLQVGFSAKRVTTLPYFCPIDPREQVRPLPESPTLLFVGRASPNKGARYFVEALGRLPATVRGVMMGSFDAGSSRQLKDLAQKSGCADRLELLPWAGREDVRAAFEGATVFVFPSIWPETLGIVGLEALASGVPVVASDVGGVREWLREGETGFLVPPKDVDALAERAERLLFDEALNRTMGERGIALIRERFSIDYHLQRLLDIYEAAA